MKNQPTFGGVLAIFVLGMLGLAAIGALSPKYEDCPNGSYTAAGSASCR